MEWVETTGRTVQEAKDRALDQLGVAEDDAEFDVLEEPRAGLFGRVRGEARVRARVRPTQPRPKAERRDRKKKGDSAAEVAVAGAPVGDAADSSAPAPSSTRRGGRQAAPASTSDATPAKRQRAKPAATTRDGASGDAAALAAAVAMVVGDDGDQAAADAVDTAPAPTRSAAKSGGRAPRVKQDRPRGDTDTPRPVAAEEKQEMDVDAAQVGEEARRFVQGLVDAFGLDGTAEVRRDEDDLEVAVEGADLGLLVGPRGVTLQAVQELTRVAAQRRLGDHDTRLRVDVAGYRLRRREALTRFAEQVASEVVSSGTARSLEPMSSSDRKVIHDALSSNSAIATRSEGDDPNRRVVIAPANG